MINKYLASLIWSSALCFQGKVMKLGYWCSVYLYSGLGSWHCIHCHPEYAANTLRICTIFYFKSIFRSSLQLIYHMQKNMICFISASLNMVSDALLLKQMQKTKRICFSTKSKQIALVLDDGNLSKSTHI